MTFPWRMSTIASKVFFWRLTTTSASRRNGAPGFHWSTSVFGGSCRRTPEYRAEESTLPDAFKASYTFQYSGAVNASRGCWTTCPAASVGKDKTQNNANVVMKREFGFIGRHVQGVLGIGTASFIDGG